MKPELKKLLILNAPYLLFVYLFDKIGQAVRLSPGAVSYTHLDVYKRQVIDASFTLACPDTTTPSKVIIAQSRNTPRSPSLTVEIGTCSSFSPFFFHTVSVSYTHLCKHYSTDI